MILFKWKYKPCGNCPVQAEGWFLGYWFYFRSRWKYATIEFAVNETAWEFNEIKKVYYLHETEQYAAGWISKTLANWLIFKGCMLFLFRQKSHDTPKNW